MLTECTAMCTDEALTERNEYVDPPTRARSLSVSQHKGREVEETYRHQT